MSLAGEDISEHIFAPIGGYCVYYRSNVFHNTHSFSRGIFSHMMRLDHAIARKRKYLMDYKHVYKFTFLNSTKE